MQLSVRLFIWLSLTLLLALEHAWAQGGAQPSEYQIKAAFLFNFIKLTEWPPQANTSPIVIGILGNNPFGDVLERTIHDKTIDNRGLVIKEFKTAQEATNCHVLFIGTSEKVRLPEIFKALSAASVLTIGESDSFVEDGGIIGFYTDGTKVRFQINDQAARQAGLKISAKLVVLATRPAR